MKLKQTMSIRLCITHYSIGPIDPGLQELDILPSLATLYVTPTPSASEQQETIWQSNAQREKKELTF